MTARVYRAEDWHPVSGDAADVIAIGAERVIDDGREVMDADPRVIRDLARTVVALRDGAPDCGTTHHTGCACHDARERELTEALQAVCDARRSRIGTEQRWCLHCGATWGTQHIADCPVGRALRVLDRGAT